MPLELAISIYLSIGAGLSVSFLLTPSMRQNALEVSFCLATVVLWPAFIIVGLVFEVHDKYKEKKRKITNIKFDFVHQMYMLQLVSLKTYENIVFESKK